MTDELTPDHLLPGEVASNLRTHDWVRDPTLIGGWMRCVACGLTSADRTAQHQPCNERTQP